MVIDPRTVIFGEIGLSGEIRAVAQADTRLREASKLGFEQAIIPPRKSSKQAGQKTKQAPDDHGLYVRELSHVFELVGWIGTKSGSEN